MTTRFAGRAKITAEPGNQISLQAAGSVVMADVARANAVSVGNAKASNVMVAIHKGTNDPFGQRIDGLLGMSFLARFNLSITANAVEFKAISLR
jgi:aspartyl protease family protein